MNFFTAIFITGAVLLIAIPAYVTARIGIRIAVKRAMINIVSGILRETSDDETLADEKCELKEALKLQNYWYTLVNWDVHSASDWERQNGMRKIGSILRRIAFNDGELFHERWIAKKKEGEADIRMEFEALETVGWLADYGLRLWMDPVDNGIRVGDRLDKATAEKMMKVLNMFDRRLAMNRPMKEAEEGLRSSASVMRGQRLWEHYG